MEVSGRVLGVRGQLWGQVSSPLTFTLVLGLKLRWSGLCSLLSHLAGLNDFFFLKHNHRYKNTITLIAISGGNTV